MGKNDMAVRKWLSDKRRFADLCNASLFGGKEIVLQKDLKIADSRSDLIFTNKQGKQEGVQRFRDIAMEWRYGMEFVILAIENQEKINYAMPVRNMIYDGLTYADQINQLWKQHCGKDEKITKEEFLSHMTKDERLNPVITIVFYYGEKKWDGGVSLYDMLKKSEYPLVNEVMKKYISDYHINLIDASRFENLQVFRTDLQLILGMLKYRSEKKELVNYIRQNKNYFGKLDYDTYHAVIAFLNSEKKLHQIMKNDAGKEEIDMCKALEDLYEEGMEKGIEKLILKKHNKGISVQDIADFIELSVEEVEDIIKQQNV